MPAHSRSRVARFDAPVRSALLLCLLCLGAPPVFSAGDSDEGGPPPPWREIVDLSRSASNPEEVARARTAALAKGEELLEAGDDSSASVVLNVAGQLLFREGRLDEATGCWERGLAAARRADYGETEASLLNSLAIGAGSSGRYEESARLFLDLTSIRAAMGDTLGSARAWYNLVLSYRSIGRIPEALRANREAMTLFEGLGETGPLTRCAVARADLLHDLGRDEEAMTWSDSALARIEEHPDLHAEGVALGNRTQYLVHLGRTDEALETIDRAIALLREGGHAFNVMDLEFDRAGILYSLGRYGEALAETRRIAPAFDSRPEGIHQVVLPTLEGSALLALGDFDRAEEVLLAAVGRVERARAGLAEDESRAGLAGRGLPAYAALADLYESRGRPIEAWRITERARGALFRAAMRPEGGADRIVALDTLQTLLAEEGAALLQYGDPVDASLLAFVITPDTLIAARLPIRGKTFVHDVRNAAELLASDLPDETILPPLRRIAGEIVTPLLPLLPAGTDRLLVVPPSSIAGFPMEALPVPPAPGGEPDGGAGGGAELGDRFALSYLPDATAALLIERRGGADGSTMIAFADPSGAPDTVKDPWEESYRSLRRTPLPEARLEAERIVPDGGVILAGGEATRARALSPEAAGAAVLHFATHALINPLYPRSSALILAAAAGDDGLLKPADIGSHRIGAELVTLSGCRTSGGYTYLGEGTYGFPRAFLLAGARSVVTSLWDVEDAAARRFMELFYGGLSDGLARDRSLQRARWEMAREGYSHRDRSAFVLTGLGHEPVAPLVGRLGGRSSYSWPALALLALVIYLAVAILVRAIRPRSR